MNYEKYEEERGRYPTFQKGERKSTKWIFFLPSSKSICECVFCAYKVLFCNDIKKVLLNCIFYRKQKNARRVIPVLIIPKSDKICASVKVLYDLLHSFILRSFQKIEIFQHKSFCYI